MAKNSLGRDLGDLLSQARPARIVQSANAPTTPGQAPASTPPDAGIGATSSMPKAVPATPSPTLVGPPPSPEHAAGEPSHRPVRHPGANRPPSHDPSSEPLLYRPVRHPAFYPLLAADFLLLLAAAVLGFGGFIGRTLAIVIIVSGGFLALAALLLPPRRGPVSNPAESRVRVRLTRV